MVSLVRVRLDGKDCCHPLPSTIFKSKNSFNFLTKQLPEVELCSSLGWHASLLSGRIHCACSTYQAFHENAPSARIGPEIYI